MSDHSPPPKFAIVMKVGFHGQEGLKAILERKQLELNSLGVCYWGYGGTLCHPTKALRSFVEFARREREQVEVFFSTTPSPFVDRTDGRAAEFSIDGQAWNALPSGADIRSSKFAITIDQLQLIDQAFPLGEYEVAVGPSAGKSAQDYLRFRVDKAALVRSVVRTSDKTIPVQIKARLVEPYAILVRPQQTS